jgi:hypothetical protein
LFNIQATEVKVDMQTNTSGSPKPTLGLSILSWKSWNTLDASLKSHREAGLLEHFDKSLILFQDLCDRDREIAEKYGLEFTGGPNCGIGEGMRRAAGFLGTDYVLFLENDCPTIAPPQQVRRELALAVEYLEKGIVDIMRLRSRLYPGEGFCDPMKYLRYYPPRQPEEAVDVSSSITPAWKRGLRRIFKPYNIHLMKGRSIYLEKYPEKIFPDAIRKTEDDIWISDSSCTDWTNQSVMMKRTLFLDILMPYVDAHPSGLELHGFQEPERPLNCRWWRRQRFKIGQGAGLFSHNRFDGSWRPDHPGYGK